MNIPYLLRRAVSVRGDSPAIRTETGSVTYREFAAAVARRAVRFAALGLERGDRVAVLMNNSPQYLELYFSTALAGILIVPINTRWNAGDIVFALDDSGTKALYLDDRFAPLAPEIQQRLPGLKIIIETSGMEASATEPGEFPEPAPDDLVGLFYTSGTTGGPKGVMLTHRNLYANAMTALLENIGGDYTYLHVLPMFHLGDLCFLFSTVLAGGCHVFLPTFDPEGVLAAVERYKIDYLALVPTMWNSVLNHPALGKYDLSSVRVTGWGAAPMPEIVQEKMMRLLPGRRYMHVYGMTEAAPLITAAEIAVPTPHAGRAVYGAEVRIFDDDDRELPAGENGEIVVRGDCVMKGYWRRPEITAEVLRGGWLHTGDIGSLDGRGNLTIRDRKKDMIKTGGECVYSPEVESCLMDHPAVLEAAIVGVPHDKWGETIRAVVATRSGATLSEAALIAWCRERMTHFKCPTSVRFVDALPKTATGKVHKPSLRNP